MRRKTQMIDNFQDGDKYEIQGWNNDADDFADNNNLLRILQKKITFPLLEKDHVAQKKVRRKLQTLPSIGELPKKPVDIPKTQLPQNVHLSPVMKVQKRQKIQSLDNENLMKASLKKSPTEKKKIFILEKQKNILTTDSNISAEKKKNRSMKNLFRIVESINNKGDNGSLKKIGEIQGRQNIKHQKMASVESFPIKLKLAAFDEKNQEKHSHSQKVDKKLIRWDKFNVNKQRTTINFYQGKDSGPIPPIIIEAHHQKMLKRKEKSYHEIQSNSQWLQKMLSKNKLQKTTGRKRQKLHTEVKDYFLDEHLQSPFGETKTGKFNY